MMANSSPPHQKARQRRGKSFARMKAENGPELEQALAELAEDIRYWEKAGEAIDKAVEFLSLAGADELVETLMATPLGMVKGLLKNPSELEKFLQFKQEEETEAVHKLSSMQKEILLKLLSETGGYREVRWTPKEWFGATAPSERAAFSTSLKRLESRGLVKRHSVDKTGEPKRTAVVKLTDLGHLVAKRLTGAC